MKKMWRVESGDLKWKGQAQNRKAAVIAAFAKGLPKHLSFLVRIHDGTIWRYWDIRQALKAAGYSVKQIPKGGILVR